MLQKNYVTRNSTAWVFLILQVKKTYSTMHYVSLAFILTFLVLLSQVIVIGVVLANQRHKGNVCYKKLNVTTCY